MQKTGGMDLTQNCTVPLAIWETGVLLADGWRLVFGTSSNVGMPLAASKITNTSISDLYLKAMKNYIPSVDEIEVPYEFNY
jgi:hypothetical protein